MGRCPRLTFAGILFPAIPAGIPIPADPAGILFPADLAELITIGVDDVAVAGAAPLAVPDMFTEPELVAMIVADEVQTVDGVPVCFGGDGDDVGCEDPRDIIARSGWIGVTLALQMDIVGFSRMSGRPSRLFQVVTPSGGPG